MYDCPRGKCELVAVHFLIITSFAIDPILCKLAGNKTCIISGMSSNFGQIGTIALDCLRNIPLTYNGKMMSPCQSREISWT